jgi:hypothetical protein
VEKKPIMQLRNSKLHPACVEQSTQHGSFTPPARDNADEVELEAVDLGLSSKGVLESAQKHFGMIPFRPSDLLFCHSLESKIKRLARLDIDGCKLLRRDDALDVMREITLLESVISDKAFLSRLADSKSNLQAAISKCQNPGS